MIASLLTHTDSQNGAEETTAHGNDHPIHVHSQKSSDEETPHEEKPSSLTQNSPLCTLPQAILCKGGLTGLFDSPGYVLDPDIPRDRWNSVAGGNVLANVDIGNAFNCYKLQVDVLWLEESPLLFDAYRTCSLKCQLMNSKVSVRILDIGCGTGELITRLVGQNGLFEQLVSCTAELCSIDAIELDRSVYEACKERFKVLQHSTKIPLLIHHACATKLPFESDTFDFVLNRHMLHCVPTNEISKVLNEIHRVLKPGGIVHFVAEDTEMIYSSADNDEKFSEQKKLWSHGIREMSMKFGNDVRIGRKLPAMLTQCGFVVQSVKFALVDTCRIHRQLLISIFESWRRMHADTCKNNNIDYTYEKYFDNIIDIIKDEQQYVCWSVPIIQANKQTISKFDG